MAEQLLLIPPHKHGKDCYLRAGWGFAYTPCRADGLDRNLTILKEVDFSREIARKCCTLICDKKES